MIVRVFTTDGADREIEFNDVSEVIVYTDTLVPLGRLDLRQKPRETEDDFIQCPHEMVRATCAGACMCPCAPCAPSRATADKR